MKIKTLSICVPAGCPNNCPFCVSKLHSEKYVLNDVDWQQGYIDRLNFASTNGYNCLMFTGTGEPIFNTPFMKFVADAVIGKFQWLELQTTGVGLDYESLVWLRSIGIKTISLSVSDIFSSANNALIMDTPKQYYVLLERLCGLIIAQGFNLRLSLNMTKVYNTYDLNRICARAQTLGANQLTIRKLYYSKDINADMLNKWIKDNACHPRTFDKISKQLKKSGRPLELLSYGDTKYSYNGMSVVVIKDCMATEILDEERYLILRPNGKLYTKWDDQGSLLF